MRCRSGEPHAMQRGGFAGRRALLIIAWPVVLGLVGCDRGPMMVPVRGTVLYNGKPLEFGSVTFQPRSGQPAQGDIQPDGTFSLSTYRLNDGAVVGAHKVRIVCYESQRNPGAKRSGEQSLGRLLIPTKYTLVDQSGLTAEVLEGDDEPLVFELSGPAGQ